MPAKTATRLTREHNGKTNGSEHDNGTAARPIDWAERDRENTQRLRTQRAVRVRLAPYSRAKVHEAAVQALGQWTSDDPRVTAAHVELARAVAALPQTRRQNDELLDLAFKAINAERDAMCEAWLARTASRPWTRHSSAALRDRRSRSGGRRS